MNMLLVAPMLNGLQLGVILFLIAAGLTLVFGVMDPSILLTAFRTATMMKPDKRSCIGTLRGEEPQIEHTVCFANMISSKIASTCFR